MKYLFSLLLILSPTLGWTNMDDDFPAPFDFEDELAKEAALDAAETLEASSQQVAIPLPQEPTRKMPSKPLVVKPNPDLAPAKSIPSSRPVTKAKSKSEKTSQKLAVNKTKAENLKKKQAQALKKLGGSKKATK